LCEEQRSTIGRWHLDGGVAGREGSMFLLSNLLAGIAQVLDLLLTFYMWIMIARIVISWVNADPHNQIVRAIISVTDPLLYRIRRVLPSFAGGLDLSPLVVFAAIVFIRAFVVRSLFEMAARLQ
jgi:YggT family protein